MNSYFVIDSDGKIAKDLKKVMADYPMFLSIGNSNSYEQSMNIILKRKPDLVFLNLDNVIESPFELVTELNSYLEIIPDFVAVSSSNENSYKALKHGFIDYLMTPLVELEIRKLALKFKKKQSSKTNRTLCLQSYKDFQYLNTDEILFLKADNNTTDFYLNDGSVISAFKTLKIFENALPNNFLRIHKSYVVNKDYVSRINYGNLKCSVINTVQKIPFTKTYLSNIEFIKDSLSDLSIQSQN
ncbi:response regulator transcription factor [Subsaximicrobium wynnwilliamsii]|uniref:Response regulator transcription factor n=1 Tax=Subsaximicrobium wynnwilliamsii TaxID=291179 RepID=A0A5C6ZCJ8_9FLAO|nr:LytTR family DNA-binding domain-containing protein [Subsaximicrobium wynnwilliamsii]TXD82116.1 response regulator transcription factor [Subsaximicrobium wynnwilliamsii]TXD87761.1 response regulator transcription factor [Subsaximicrobium wynnwilliamsii]TXE01572.1 response regulator transcription factor [Subsaximicrobium wynnwilliamsii]